MASRQPIDSGSSPQVSPWYAYPPACDRSYLAAAVRAAAIALVLLVILVLVVVL